MYETGGTIEMTDTAEATIASTIQSARYNEAVVVTVNDDSNNNTSEIVLIACLDTQHGGIEWKNAATSSDEDAVALQEDIGIIRHLRTKRWVLPMLNDHRRNILYDNAVRNACNEIVKRRCAADATNGRKEDSTIRILDIGSGTGLLAMMGARYSLNAIQDEEQKSDTCEHGNNNMKVNVTSVEMASAMARLARLTIDENDLSNNIKVIEQHSTDVSFSIDDSRFVSDGENTNQKGADICTSELLESGLLGEGVLPSIRDAWSRHLKDDAIVVPRRARVFAVLIEGMHINTNSSTAKDTASSVNTATAYLGPELHAFHKASGGVWMSTNALTSNETGGQQLLGSKCCDSGDNNDTGGITIPLHANAMLDQSYRDNAGNLINGEGLGDDFRGIRPLTEPTMVLDFDFASGLAALPPSTGRSIVTTLTPTSDGLCHAVLFWWELDLFDGDFDNCTYSTEPIGFTNKTTSNGDLLWQDHWQQCLFVFGDSNLQNKSKELSMGTPVQIIASHDDTSISFSINTDQRESGSDSRPIQRRRLNEQNGDGNVLPQAVFNRHITSTRALQLNDSSRIQTLAAAIKHCIDIKGKDSPILDLSDFGLCAMMASLSGAKKVTSLESSSGTLPTIAATVAQIGNSLPRPGAEFQIIQALPEHIRDEHIVGGPAEVVVAEPYYEMLEGWHLQEALNYFYLIRAMKVRGLITPNALAVPSYAKVMATVVQFDEFFSAYGQVGEHDSSVAGFRHKNVNHFGDQYHTYDVSLPMWQYRYKQLSKTFCIAKISYEGAAPTIDTINNDSVELVSSGIAHAVLIWVDYGCRTSSGGSDGGEDKFDIISTATPSHRQLVRKLPKQVVITSQDIQNGTTSFHFKASFGNDRQGIEDHSFDFELHQKVEEEE